MGYCTHYSVAILPDSEVIRHIIENDDNLYAIHEDADSYKWYDHESDMRNFSAKFPDYTFQLSGEGEDSGDIWRKYFCNGKMQHCPAQITYEPFDESKLQ
ncbi:hypothetical protein BBD42_15435 [Paenibacillus sp. BIHB 4019]|uniref:Uncharacterized protein n=1 Tax=Paenibacillus sp. BIHB 4019 TaxID=1870819 RepID=A0A1B2DJ31_9BACL|nr:hypothetical protein [Paenibacillus sp. BIHB 4019]ANY67703.1 hypothetical protein BBD42_15435 [Paenibacillus sp. BIHB 4019]